MTLSNLSQPPFNCSLLGVAWGAAQYYNLDHSRGLLYGGSGHAFLINIHRELCPSGPYVWNHEPFYALARNLGFAITELGFVDQESDAEARAELEHAITTRLEEGVVCGIINLDHQLVLGHDEGGLMLAQPWGENADTTPSRLSFSTWVEYGEELHAGAYEIRAIPQAAPRETVIRSLAFAIGLWEHPDRYAFEHYAIGPAAYDKWIAAVEAGHGADHGAWWNATVWSECRDAAKEYLREIARHFPHVKTEAHELSGRYGTIAEKLHAAGERALAVDEKQTLLADARDLEADSVALLRTIREALASAT